jgi:hypothetical protein
MKNEGIRPILKRINLHELGNFNGEILTGTTIKILLIKMIDNISDNFVYKNSKIYLNQVNQNIKCKK